MLRLHAAIPPFRASRARQGGVPCYFALEEPLLHRLLRPFPQGMPKRYVDHSRTHISELGGQSIKPQSRVFDDVIVYRNQLLAVPQHGRGSPTS
jgi:hypothetical protein